MKACKVCHRLVDKASVESKKKGDAKGAGDDSICPACHNPTSKTWQGYVVIQDAKRSRIARKMNITTPGRFALKVR